MDLLWCDFHQRHDVCWTEEKDDFVQEGINLMDKKHKDELKDRVRVMVHGVDSHGALITPFGHGDNGCVYCGRLIDFVLAEIRRSKSNE